MTKAVNFMLYIYYAVKNIKCTKRESIKVTDPVAGAPTAPSDPAGPAHSSLLPSQPLSALAGSPTASLSHFCLVMGEGNPKFDSS